MATSIRCLVVGGSRVQRIELVSLLEPLDGLDVVYSMRCKEKAISRLSRDDIDAVFLLSSEDDGFGKEFISQISGEAPAGATLVLVTSEPKIDHLRGLRSPTSRGPNYLSMPMTSQERSSFVQDVSRVLRLRTKMGVKLRLPKIHVSSPPEMICVISSTGGPEALGELLSGLGGDFDLPILITQHMPKPFIDKMCENLSRHAKRSVVRAVDGCSIRAGGVYVAPGDAHLCLRKAGGGYVCVLAYGPPSAGCMPAGNVMLESAAKATCGRMIGVCLTGMGQDGALGMAFVRQAGGTVVVQDEASSVVWGMPGSIVERGDAHHILPVAEIALKILRMSGKESDVSRAS